MSTPVDNLNIWITAFRSVWNACGMINAGARKLSWNAFANAKVSDLLPGHNSQVNFIAALRSQFAANGLSDYPISGLIAPADTFADFTNHTVGLLSNFVFDLVKGVCPATCFNPEGALLKQTTLAVAFPGGAIDGNWLTLMNEVKSSNLDNVLAPTALSDANAEVTPPGVATLADLMTTLSKL